MPPEAHPGDPGSLSLTLNMYPLSVRIRYIGKDPSRSPECMGQSTVLKLKSGQLTWVARRESITRTHVLKNGRVVK